MLDECDIEDIGFTNDAPWASALERAFLVRFIGEDAAFGVVVARDRDELFWLIDEHANPYECEVSVIETGALFVDARRRTSLTERLSEVADHAPSWRPVDDGTLFLRERAEKLAKAKNEVRALRKMINDLERRVK